MLLNIKNKSLKIVIADKFKLRLIGFIGKKNITYGMLFPKCNSIHTLFMRENITVIGLDENYKVIFKKENIKPFKFVKVNYNYKKTSILELPTNTSFVINIDDILCFKEEDII